MKTVVQELIEQVHPNFFTEQEKKFWIEKEKQQIIDCYNDAYQDPPIYSEDVGKKYYDETYNNDH